MSNDKAVVRVFNLWAKIAMMIVDGKRDATKVADTLQTILNPPSELAPGWREEDGVIYFSVTSDGTTGEDWITRLVIKGFRLSDYAKSVLRSPDFKPTNNVATEVAVLKAMLFEGRSRTTSNIRAEADKRKLSKPNAELACLIREKFTDKEIEAMGLWYIVAMHEPINDSDGDPDWLGASRGDVGLGACGPGWGNGWGRGGGFAFAGVRK